MYLLGKRRDLLVRYVLLQSGAVVLGAAVFGFNPYVTNTVHRGNPFYPWSGSAAYPGFNDPARDPNELYETPKNLVGHSRVFRLGYALFGRPGAQPVCGGNNARLMWPFVFGWEDLQMYRIHGLRIAGFGPLFSGAFLVGLGLLGAVLVRPGAPRLFALLLAGTIVASLLISTHTWWARYAPQLWWLPIIAVIAGLAAPHRRLTQGSAFEAISTRWRSWPQGIKASTADFGMTGWIASGLAALLLVNAALVAFVHFRWEVGATCTLRQQLADLRSRGEIEVDFQYFREPWSERLRAAGVSFRAVRRLSCDHPLELVSVAPGYPGAVRVCVPTPASPPSAANE